MEGKTKVCMNAVCASSNTAAVEWEKGWPLQSGGCATLCHNCGTAYKELVFCEMFHSEDTGWRECTSCGKRLHCGCVASSLSLVLLDTGGVNCIGCSKSSKLPPTASQEKLTARDLSTENGSSRKFDPVVSAQTSDDIVMGCSVDILPAKLGNDFSAPGEVGYRTEMNFNQSFIEPAKNDDMLQENLRHESLVHMNLSIGLSASSNLNPLSLSITEEKELSSGISSHQQVFRTHHLLPKLSNSILATGSETKSRTISPTRVARPPVEGRIKNQLLPRYWPRITDQELQQISGDSNSTIVPLFEKVLSASDAGRIGRLVLPKACAEAYFPPISQPEGLPLRIQDQKGKEWVFQFRFWPNNNSRMYVLEGVTPCIQSLQLQAGDTVTFSRMDPEGKLLMGFRKASNSASIKDSHSSINIGAFSGDTLLAAAENLHVMNDYSGFLQPSKGNRNSSLSLFSKHVNSPQIVDKNGSKPGDNQALQLPERKRSQNIGPKSKRLLMDGQDALELKLSWDELQDFLRPPPSAEPSTIAIEDHEFEEFEEPPVFGKRSIFIARLSGEQEQWTQCDSCFKWRKVSYDLLLPPKWTCHVNGNDQTRSSCAAPDELNALELENLLKMSNEFKRRRVGTSLKSMHGQESPEVVEIVEKASSVVGGGDIISSEAGGWSSSAAATTTRHPRHRPGCSCIVCIQPPSGKGKHKPTCTCNVCMTVKRRFKTLMMRKQKRQWEREEAQIANAAAKEEAEVDSIVSFPNPKQVSSSENKLLPSRQQFQENAETCSVKLDLNCCPGSRQDQRGTPCTSRVSMTSLVQEASLPLETYLRQNGLTSLLSDQQQPTSPSPHVVSQVPEDILTHAHTQVNQNLSDVAQQHEESDGFSGKDEGENELS